MKTELLILFLVLFVPNGNLFLQEVQDSCLKLPVRESGFRWINDSWNPEYKIENKYNSSCNITEESYFIWKVSNYIGEYINIYDYDSLQNMISYEKLIWKNGQWENSNLQKDFFTVNRKDSSIIQDWINNNWINQNKSVNLFDQKNNITQYTAYIWSNSEGWVISFMKHYLYNENNDLIELLRSYWINDSLYNYRKDVDYYENGNLIKHQIFVNEDYIFWYEKERYGYKYDSLNRKIEETQMKAEYYNLENRLKIEYFYDNNDNVVLEYGFGWNNNWLLSWRNVFKFDSNNNQLEYYS